MGIASTASPKMINQLLTPQTSNPTRLMEVARWAEKTAFEVENHWEELSEKRREILVAFAYTVIDPPEDFGTKVKRVRGRARLAWTYLRGEEDALKQFLFAADRLLEAILTAIERDNPQYQEDLRHSLEELKNDATKMDGEQAGEWVRGIFNRTLD